jgi:hypothetical protein
MSAQIVYVIDQMRKRNLRAVEPSKKAEGAWVDTIIKTAALRKTFYEECVGVWFLSLGRFVLELLLSPHRPLDSPRPSTASTDTRILQS